MRYEKGKMVVYTNGANEPLHAYKSDTRSISGNVVRGMTVEEVFDFLESHVAPCTNCGEEITTGGGQYMAGHYCNECWEEYKAQHNHECVMCGRPAWDCYC